MSNIECRISNVEGKRDDRRRRTDDGGPGKKGDDGGQRTEDRARTPQETNDGGQRTEKSGDEFLFFAAVPMLSRG